ncbi:MAG: hypothetical protein DMF03_14145 [Verrucomicrobia bacterium]|nr:MAG: hypothetical protein DMF03_14145 [Verrucomicrobiota bacterium]
MKTTVEPHRILIIDDERPILMTLDALLTRRGYQTETAATSALGLRAMRAKPAELVLLDLQLPDADGLETLDRIKKEFPETQVIILTAHDSLNNAIESIKRGAFHFVSKPYAPEELLSLAKQALQKQSLLRETQELREKTEALEKRLELAETRLAPVFQSKAMQQMDELITAMAPSDANVLITGESGVGKEIVANVIHSRSRRAVKPLVKLNCAAFPQTMIESELFGYVKGAFTGAMNDFRGMIAEASGGTLFLDEIFRVIAATNRPIAQALAENRLRSDLYYRINTFQIEVPPLRERKEDIPPLVSTFVQRFAAQLGKPEPTIAPEVYQKLLDYSWPGNVRELQNAIEYAVVLAREDVITVKELPAEIQLPPALQGNHSSALRRNGVASLEDVERETILQALAQTHGNKKKAAQLLGIQRPTLYNKMKRYAIEI